METATTRGIMLVEDDHLVRSAIGMLLQKTFAAKIIEAGSAGEARRSIDPQNLDLAIVDVDLPGEDGISLLEWIREEHPDIPVLMFTGLNRRAPVREALGLGASGFVLKGATVEQFTQAVETALSRTGAYVHPGLTRYLLEDDRLTALGLSARDLRILRLLAHGATNDRIAHSLQVSPKTLKGSLTRIYRALGVGNRTEAVAKAMEEELI